jgi:nitrogen regulatory protein PII
MKTIFITCDQAHYRRITQEMTHLNLRGFTSWQPLTGRGSKTGEPHYGSKAWPGLNSAIITIVEDEAVDPFLDFLKKLDEKTPELGLRAFVWNVEKSI